MPEQFFGDEIGSPFVWGRTDCAHTGDRWAQRRAGVSFIAALGVDFADQAGAEALMSRFAMPIWIGRAMRAAGFRPTRDPVVGDIGVIVVGPFLALAIRGSHAWLWRDENGIHSTPLSIRVLASWRIECSAG